MDPGCHFWTAKQGGYMEGAAACQPRSPTGHPVTGLTGSIRASDAL